MAKVAPLYKEDVQAFFDTQVTNQGHSSQKRSKVFAEAADVLTKAIARLEPYGFESGNDTKDSNEQYKLRSKLHFKEPEEIASLEKSLPK